MSTDTEATDTRTPSKKGKRVATAKPRASRPRLGTTATRKARPTRMAASVALGDRYAARGPIALETEGGRGPRRRSHRTRTVRTKAFTVPLSAGWTLVGKTRNGRVRVAVVHGAPTRLAS